MGDHTGPTCPTAMLRSTLRLAQQGISRASFSNNSNAGLATLVVADHDNSTIRPSTLSTITAALKLGGDTHLLVAGKDCKAAADAGAKIAGVKKVLVADDASLANELAENIAPVLQNVTTSGGYTHV